MKNIIVYLLLTHCLYSQYNSSDNILKDSLDDILYIKDIDSYIGKESDYKNANRIIITDTAITNIPLSYNNFKKLNRIDIEYANKVNSDSLFSTISKFHNRLQLFISFGKVVLNDVFCRASNINSLNIFNSFVVVDSINCVDNLNLKQVSLENNMMNEQKILNLLTRLKKLEVVQLSLKDINFPFALSKNDNLLILNLSNVYIEKHQYNISGFTNLIAVSIYTDRMNEYELSKLKFIDNPNVELTTRNIKYLDLR